MSNSTVIKREKFRESRTDENTVQSVESAKPVVNGNKEKKAWMIDVIGSILAIFVGLFVYNILGVADGVDSLMGKISIGIVVVACYVVVFRYALRSK